MSFDFKLASENDVLKHLSSLRTKNSADVDGISVKLFKRLSSALINPLTLIINQPLVTGIFPAKLRIAKVLPLFKKEDHTVMDIYRLISYLTVRSQYVEIDGVSSRILTLSTGVPHGSILGPLLLLIYMNDEPYCSNYFNFIVYADDTTLNSTIQIPSMSPIDINSELAKVYDWLAMIKCSCNMNNQEMFQFI